ncbi:MAG: hypothetical protein ABW123_18620 [Cystobacter sp.]
MRADLFVCSGVLFVGLLMACHGDVSPPDAGTDVDSGVFQDGGGPGDGPTEPDPEPGETGCSVARQTGCAAGEVCLRGVSGDGGVSNQCFPGECDPVAQNCPEGNRCTYVRRDNVTSRRCVPAGTGTVAEGGTCQSTATAEGDFYDTCAPGLACTDRSTSGGTTFTCQRLCHGGNQCAAPNECIDVLRFEGSNERPRVCGAPKATCDLLAPQCATPLGCYPSNKHGACVATGAIADGQSCTYVNDCQPGSACVKDGQGLVCRKLCRAPTGAPGCDSGQRCQSLQDYSAVGVCVR